MLTITEDVQKRLQRQATRSWSRQVIGGTNVQFAATPRPAASSSSRSTRAPRAPRRWPPRRRASPSRWCRRCWRGPHARRDPCGKHGTLARLRPGRRLRASSSSPRWAFEKFKGAEDKLGTQMRAVGEVMAIGKTYQGGLPEGHPLAGERPLRPGLRQGLPRQIRRGAARACWSRPRPSAVHHCTRRCARCDGRRAPRADPHQALVPRADGGARGRGGGAASRTKASPPRPPTTCCRREEGWLLRPLPGQLTGQPRTRSAPPGRHRRRPGWEGVHVRRHPGRATTTPPTTPRTPVPRAATQARS